MRWSLILALVVACDGEPTPVDTDTGDTQDTEDTDTTIPVQWVDRTIETSTTLTDVYSGGGGAWVVGEDGKAWRLDNGQADTMETGVEADLLGLWGQGDGSSANLVAVGYAGSALRLVADDWVAFEDTTLGTTNFEDVDGTSTDLTAVSATGIYRFDGTSWTFEDNGANAHIRAVWVESGGNAWAVGDNGIVLRREAGVWSSVRGAPSGVDLRDVHGSGGDVYIVGNRGTLWHLSGGEFTDIETDTTLNLSGVWVSSLGNVFVVGNNGLAMKYDPDREPADSDSPVGGFDMLPTGTQSNLYAVYGSGEDNVWAVGNRGAVFRYTGSR